MAILRGGKTRLRKYLSRARYGAAKLRYGTAKLAVHGAEKTRMYGQVRVPYPERKKHLSYAGR